MVVLPTIQAYSTKYQRMDLVFDVYQPSSLKTRTKRGRGVRRRVESKGKIPQNWQNFLRNNDNKTDLFNFLADKISQMSTPNTVIVTRENDVASNHEVSMDGLAPCCHEEADTRIFVHAVEEGSKVLMIKANDTDVLVIAISVLSALQDIGLQQLWWPLDSDSISNGLLCMTFKTP